MTSEIQEIVKTLNDQKYTEAEMETAADIVNKCNNKIFLESYKTLDNSITDIDSKTLVTPDNSRAK